MRTLSLDSFVRCCVFLLGISLCGSAVYAQEVRKCFSIPEVHVIQGLGMFPVQATVDYLKNTTLALKDGEFEVKFAEGKSISGKVGSTDAKINEKAVKLSAAPFEHLGVIYVPTEQLFKPLDAKVEPQMVQNMVNIVIQGPSGPYVIAFPFNPADLKSKTTVKNYFDGDAELYMMNLDGTGMKRLSFNTYEDELPLFIPNDDRIVYTRQAKMYLRNVTNREEIQLGFLSAPQPQGAAFGNTKAATPIPYPFPKFVSSDGESLIFTSEAPRPLGGRPFPGTVGPRIPGQVGPRIPGQAGPLQPGVMQTISTPVYSCDLTDNTGTATKLPIVGSNYSPQPNGKFIAYSQNGTVYLSDPSSPKSKIPVGGGDQPVFSPNGQVLMYAGNYNKVGGEKKQCSMLVTIQSRGQGADSVTTEPKSIECTGNETEASFSPDSKQIVFCKSGIKIMDVDRTNQKSLTSHPNDSSPRFTPDGKSIVFLRDGKLMMKKIEGAEIATALPVSIKVAKFTFSPSGELFYLGYPEGNGPKGAKGPGKQGGGTGPAKPPSGGGTVKPPSDDGGGITY